MLEVKEFAKVSQDVQLKLKQDFIKALEDRKFNELIQTLKADENILMKYTSRLKEASIEFDNCKNCHGLETCHNKIKGFSYVPTKDNNIIIFSYKECHFKAKDSYKDNVLLFDVPQAIKNASFKDLYKDKNRIEIIKKMKSFMDNYFVNKEKAIYLHGSFGSGKTYLIGALFNEMAKKGVRSSLVYYPELLRNLKSSFSSDYEESKLEIKNALADGVISEASINHAALKVLAWKYYKGLIIDSEK